MTQIHYDPQEFGAVPGGEILCTAFFQAAIDACHEAGGGVVRCGPGVYQIGSIDLKSNVELNLTSGCRIVGSPNLSDYRPLVSPGFKHELAPEGTALYLIGASHSRNIAITGAGEIDGEGVAFYDQSEPLNSGGRFAKKPPQRPRLVMAHRCEDVRFENARFIDSACWTFWLMQCERVRVHGITILGDSRLLNNDGIDFDGCRHVTVSDCIIHTEDDCLVFRAVQEVQEVESICEDVTIVNCSLSSTHQCIRISCPNDHIVRNCLFSNLIMRGRNGVLIDLPMRFFKKDVPSRTKVSDISFSHCRIDCRGTPLRIAVEEGVDGVDIRRISVSDSQITAGKPCVLQGQHNASVSDVSFSNVSFDILDGQPFYCSGCSRVRFNDVEFL